MNRNIKPCFFTILFHLFIINALFAQDTTQVVINWLQKNAIPLKHVEAGNAFDDLKPLKQILKDVKLVGLGEATHGTREFFQMKHRLLEFLVKEMRFTVFTIESSYAGCQLINDYVLYGNGDKAAALSGQGYVAWDTEEFTAMLDWMRAYNQTVTEDKKVKFYGVDFGFNDAGREKVLAYLQKYDAAQIAATAAFFRELAQEEEKWPTRLEKDDTKRKTWFIQIEYLIAYLKKNEGNLIAASSAAEFRQILKYVQTMRQWLLVNIPSIAASRSQIMGENLLALMEEMPGANFIIWQHNGHISVNTLRSNMGYRLRQKLGNGYYALGFEFSQGSYQNRIVLPDNYLGDLIENTHPPVPAQSLPWYLSHTKKGNFLLNLRTTVFNTMVEKWLNQPKEVHNVQWFANETSKNFAEMKNLKSMYDGILFIENTTRTRPTKNALETAAKKVGF